MIAAILDHLWQSTLFAMGAGLLTLLFARNGAHIRYWLWFVASAKFLVPFSLVSDALRPLLQHFAPIAAPASILVINHVTTPFAAVMPVTASSAPHLVFLLFAIWAAGCAAFLLVWFARWEMLKEVVCAANPMDIAAPIPVKSSPRPMEPGLVGIWRPVLLLPEGITERLSPEEMFSVVAHELCHLERRDNITAALHMLVQSLFWFHPLLWWVGERLVYERERACDEQVLECGNDPHTYAQSILKICQFYLQSSLVCVPGISGADLKKRVKLIMANDASLDLGPAKKILVLGAASVALLLPLSGGLLASPVRVPGFESGSLASKFSYETYVEGLKNGVANHEELGLAVVLQSEQPFAQLVKRFGALKSVAFKGVSPEGWEVYDVSFENARAEWRIAPAAGNMKSVKQP